MKLKKFNKEFWEIIEKSGKLLSKRMWTIKINSDNEIIPWAYIKEWTYLYGKEFYTKKIYKDRKGKYKEEIFKHYKKKQYQTYIRGLRRNIKINFPETICIIKEEFLESEEGVM